VTNSWYPTEIVSAESDGYGVPGGVALDSKGFVSTVWMDAPGGSDYDIYYKKLNGIPPSPKLHTVLPNPSEIGPVNLDWDDIQSAEEYVVYRDTSYITSVGGLSPVATVTDSTYTDTLTTTGTYYYVVFARNDFGLSPISNVQSLVIKEPSGLFSSFDIKELLILGGAVLGLQIIVSVITFVVGKKAGQKSGKRKK
jgi:hypothetical protein